MAIDSSFAAQRAAVLGTKPAGSSGSSSGNNAVNTVQVTGVNPDFVAQRAAVIKNPYKAPVSNTPVEVSQPTQQPSLVSQAGDQAKKLIKRAIPQLDKSTRPAPIANTVPQTNEKLNLTNMKVGEKIDLSKINSSFDLGPAQENNSAKLTQPTAQKVLTEGSAFGNAVKPVDQQVQKAFDVVFKLPDRAITATQNAIVNKASQENFDVNNDKMLKTLTTVQDNVENGVKVGNTRVPIFNNPLYRGIQKGVAGTFLGSSQQVHDTLYTRLPQPTTIGGKVVETVGGIVGGLASMYAGGSVLKSLGAGKTTLPLLFGIVGQTSAGPDVNWKQRITKMPVDVITGYILSAMPQSASVFTKAGAKTAAQVAVVSGGSSFVSNLVEGLPPEQAAKAAAKAAVVTSLLHMAFTSLNPEVRRGSVEFTPDEAKSKAIDMFDSEISANKENSKILMKLAMQAEAEGKNIKIDLEATKRSPLADAVGLKTPEGVTHTVELVEGAGQTNALPSGEVTTNGPAVSNELVPSQQTPAIAPQSETTAVVPAASGTVAQPATENVPANQVQSGTESQPAAPVAPSTVSTPENAQPVTGASETTTTTPVSAQSGETKPEVTKVEETVPTTKQPEQIKSTVEAMQNGERQPGSTLNGPKTEQIPHKEGYSRFQERLEEQLLQSNGAKYDWNETEKKYNKVNLNKDAEAAIKLMSDDPERAVRIARGFEEPKTGEPLRFDVANAVALKALDEGNTNLATELFNKTTHTATRYGQNIASLRGNFNDNSPQNYIKQLIQRRMNRLGKNIVTNAAEVVGKANSAATKATEKIDREVEKLQKVVRREMKLKQNKIKMAQDIIDSLKCD